MAEPRCCLAHSLFNVAMRFPERVAVIHAHNGGFDAAAGDVSYTFGELWNSVHELVQQLDRELAKLDANGTVFSGSLLESSVKTIGILITQSAEYLAALMAVSKIRAVFVPLDPSWPVARIVAIANDSKISLIIGCNQSNWTPQGYEHGLDEVSKAAHCPLIHMAECRKGTFKQEEICWSCSDLPFSYIMYTSGSTGKPKGVCGTERGLLNRLQWMERAYPYVPSDLACFKTAISFIDHLTESLGPLLAGTLLVIPFRDNIKHNSLGLLSYLEAYKITRLTAVPSLLHALLPAMRAPSGASAVRTLRVVVSSGESLSSSLLAELQHVMPNTTILNLYGSTEVSGDCTYFDCNALLRQQYEHKIVPIGKPIPGCYVGMISDNGSLSSVEKVGELYVGGIGIAHGYWNDATGTSQKFVNLPDSIDENTCQGSKVFKTGDVARRLENGSIILLGRKDRVLKVHGQRIQPQEIESNLKEHSEVADAAVSSPSLSNNDTQLVAYVVTKSRDEERSDNYNLRDWLKARLPLYMVPDRFIFMKAMPLTDSGKVDYSALEDLKACDFPRNPEAEIKNMEAVERIVQVFSQVLLIEKISPFEDFFLLGGTSVSAAHVAHILGIDMRLLLKHRSALKLHDAIESLQYQTNGKQREATSEGAEKSQGLLSEHQEDRGEFSMCNCHTRKRQKTLIDDAGDASLHQLSWPCGSFYCRPSAFIRSNRSLLFEGGAEQGGAERLPLVSTCPFDSTKWSIQQVWQHCLHACVDASPLLLVTDSHYRVFVGSHAHKFLCLDAISGKMEWETTLGGRIESTAAITHNFSQIVVGCYDGRIYFLDTDAGSILWSFQTGGEVKCQPTVDPWRGLVWCGSHDHSIYVLDPVSHACIWKNLCDGSIFAAPVVDAVHKRVYIATTNGKLMCICTEPSYGIAWEHASDAPIFGSPNVDPSTGNVLFASADGFVTALSSTSSIAWKVKTEGPIFAGLSISSAINYQVLVCARDGHVYSYCQMTGRLLWKGFIGEPIVAGAWVDETIQLLNRDEASTYRFVCVCGTSGTVCILRVRSDVSDEHARKADVVAKVKLPGELFSSPLMFGGRIFVGCRDNNVYCLDLLQNNQQVLSACKPGHRVSSLHQQCTDCKA